MNDKHLYYLSHPYTSFGDPIKNRLNAFHIQVKLYRHNDITILNPILLLPMGLPDDIGMKKCKSLYDACDALILCPGWEKSTGCREEYQWALAENKPIYIIDENYVLKRLEQAG